MKKLALLTFALIAAGAANAAGSSGEDEYNEQNRSQFASSLTRAEVREQLAEAIRSGDIDRGGEATPSYAVNQQAASQQDRGAVRAEAVLAAHSDQAHDSM